MSASITAVLTAFDVQTAIAPLGIEVKWVFISFLLFLGFIIWWIGGLEFYKYRREHSNPTVVYDSVSRISFEGKCFIGLIFRNNVDIPSGDISKSQRTRARIELFTFHGITICCWNGRWADNNWPRDYADIDTQNQRDLNAGDLARLDIGKRVIGETKFRTHYNWLPSLPAPREVVIEPDSYYMKVVLWAANMKERESWFTMQIPNIPQSNDLEQVNVCQVDKPSLIESVKEK